MPLFADVFYVNANENLFKIVWRKIYKMGHPD